MSPCPHVPMSPCPHVPLSPCPHVSLSRKSPCTPNLNLYIANGYATRTIYYLCVSLDLDFVCTLKRTLPLAGRGLRQKSPTCQGFYKGRLGFGKNRRCQTGIGVLVRNWFLRPKLLAPSGFGKIPTFVRGMGGGTRDSSPAPKGISPFCGGDRPEPPSIDVRLLYSIFHLSAKTTHRKQKAIACQNERSPAKKRSQPNGICFTCFILLY
ncbi:MAG: hypothetical protein F6J93_25840 [Oscillatoria sp. SIO1A7]|nr:hypothetical protein [Oscillatoria sp. SIO1A7]